MQIRLGYACLNTHLREYDIFSSRSLRLDSVSKHGLALIQQLIRNNLEDLMKIIIFNEAHGIRFYRLSSCIFPHMSNPLAGDIADYDLSFVKAELRIIGRYALEHGHRLTTHPGQYVQLGSTNPEVVKRSMQDLMNHATLFAMLGYQPRHGAVMIVHGGGTFGNRQETLQRWRENFQALPSDTRKYIALENDETSYGVQHLLPFCESLGIPFCLDVFHNDISPDKIILTPEIIQRIAATWQSHANMKIHLSFQNPELRRGAHSKSIDEIPMEIFHWSHELDKLDIMLEVKDKETSVFKLYYRYFDIEMDAAGRVDYHLKHEYRFS